MSGRGAGERTRLKICGVRLAAEAVQAVQAGATHIGCWLVRGSPRTATHAEVSAVLEATADLAHTVLVFARPATSEVLGACTATGVHQVQVHGVDEPFHRHLEAEGLVVYRVHELDRSRPRLPRLALPPTLAQPVIFDAGGLEDAGPCLWPRLQAALPPCTFLRGGITPANVAAVLVRRPFGIDVLAGAQRGPGRLDLAAVAALAAAVRAADAADGPAVPPEPAS